MRELGCVFGVLLGFGLACRDEPPRPEVVRVRELVETPAGPVYVWDAGTAARVVIPASAVVDSARWRSDRSDRETRELRISQQRATRAEAVVVEIELPAAPGAGELALVFPGGTVTWRAELWPPRDRLLATFDAASDPLQAAERALTSSSAAWATAGWLRRFRGPLAAHELDEALRQAERWRKAADRRGLRHAAYRASCARAFVLGQMGRAEDSADAALDCLARAELGGGVWARAAATYMLGQTLIGIGEGGAAERALDFAARWAEHAGLDGLAADCWSLMAVVQGRQGRLRDALRTLDAHPLVDGSSRWSRAYRWTNEGDVLFWVWRRWRSPADGQAALRLLEQARDLHEELGRRTESRSRRAEIAHVHALAGDAAAARDALGELDEADVEGAARGVPTLTRARVALLEGRVDDARALLEATLREPPGAWDGLMALFDVEARMLLAEARQRLGDTEGAARSLQRALVAVHAQMGKTDLSARPAAALERHDELWWRTRRALLRSKQLARAFALDDAHRGAVLGRLSPSPRRRAGPTASKQRATLERRLGPACLPPSTGPGCAEETRALLRELEAVSPIGRPAFARRVPSSSAGGLDGPALVERVVSALGPGEVVWVRTSTAGAMSGFSLDPTRDQPLVHGPLTLESLVERAHLFLVTDELGDFARVADALARREEGPTLSLIPYTSWLAIPSRPVSGGAVVVADTLGDLRGARREGARASAILNASVARVGHGLRAPELMRLLEDASVFHFAGHGEIAVRDPWSTFLRLGPQAVLSVQDWVFAAPSLRLVVLDGCSTSGDSVEVGEIGFAQAMLQTGTQTVLATTRSVTDDGASRFVEAFLDADGVAEPGAAFLRALRMSSSEMLADGQAFVLWGRARHSSAGVSVEQRSRAR